MNNGSGAVGRVRTASPIPASIHSLVALAILHRTPTNPIELRLSSWQLHVFLLMKICFAMHSPLQWTVYPGWCAACPPVCEFGLVYWSPPQLQAPRGSTRSRFSSGISIWIWRNSRNQSKETRASRLSKHKKRPKCCCLTFLCVATVISLSSLDQLGVIIKLMITLRAVQMLFCSVINLWKECGVVWSSLLIYPKVFIAEAEKTGEGPGGGCYTYLSIYCVHVCLWLCVRTCVCVWVWEKETIFVFIATFSEMPIQQSTHSVKEMHLSSVGPLAWCILWLGCKYLQIHMGLAKGAQTSSDTEGGHCVKPEWWNNSVGHLDDFLPSFGQTLSLCSCFVFNERIVL